MADNNDPSGWRLKLVEKTLAYDPHLEHQKLAEKVDRPDPAVRFKGADGRTYVDVIAKLRESKKIPKELQVSQRPVLGDIVTGRVALEEIETVRKNVHSLKAATELHLDLFHSVPDIRCDPASLQDTFGTSGLDGSGVIIGVVDVGCDIKHPSFVRSATETRLLSLWDQSDPPPGSTGRPPDGFDYGRELTAAQINAALLQKDPYSALKYSPGVAAHGTHVLDIAAGNGRELNRLGGRPGIGREERAPRGVAPGADLIFVHLKTDEKQFLGNSRQLLEAVEYIFTKAKAEGRPAVVNLSLSTSGGPHDGTTLVEQGFEHLLREPGRAIVISAGNAFTKGSHAQGTVRAGAQEELRWHVDPRGKNELEVWYSGQQSLRVTLVKPEDKETGPVVELGPVKPGESYAIEQGEEVWGRISHRTQDPNNGDDQIDIRLSSPKGKTLEGVWTVRLEADPGQDVPFHAWIEQDDQGAGRFENPSSDATLGSICCSQNLLTVGAYDTSTRAYLTPPYEATAAGKTRDNREKPDVSAPGVNVVAARSHGGTTVMSGTSMAAPHVTGLVALLFQYAQQTGQGLLQIEETRRLLIDSARRVSASGWDARLGWGRIDGVAALNLLDQRPVQARPQSIPLGLALGEPSGLERRMQRIENTMQQLTEAINSLAVRIVENPNGGNGQSVHPGVLETDQKTAKGRSKRG